MLSTGHAWKEVGPGVHAWVHPRGDWGISNAGLVIGAGEEALLIDTQWDEPATRRMLAAAPLPEGGVIGTLVNTHEDGDHTWGNAAVHAARIIASDATAAGFGHEDPHRFGRLAKIAKQTSNLPIVRIPRIGQPVRDFQILGRYLAAMGEGWDYAGVHLTEPTDTFSGTFDLEIGGRAIVLKEVGPAHAHGDTIVHLPADGIVFAGDIVFSGVCPIMWIGPVSNWIGALDDIIAMDPAVVVPGHGPVSTLAEVRVMRDYLQWAVTVGEAQRAAGDSVAKAAATAIRTKDYGRSAWADWISPERLIVTLTALGRDADGQAPISTTAERAKVMSAVAQLADRRASGR